jgi:hypothetical protein
MRDKNRKSDGTHNYESVTICVVCEDNIAVSYSFNGYVSIQASIREHITVATYHCYALIH